MKGTRAAISDALAFAYLGSTQIAGYLTYLCRIDKSNGIESYQMAMEIQLAKIRAAVNAQPEPINLWLAYCYGPDVQAINKPAKQALIAKQVTAKAFNGSGGHRKANRLAAIAYMAVEDYRIGQIMGKELPVSAYLDFAEIPVSNWYRDWEPHRRKALMQIKSYDLDGIGKVSVVVKQIREAEGS